MAYPYYSPPPPPPSRLPCDHSMPPPPPPPPPPACNTMQTPPPPKSPPPSIPPPINPGGPFIPAKAPCPPPTPSPILAPPYHIKAPPPLAPAPSYHYIPPPSHTWTPPPSGGNHHTAVIAACVSLGGLFLLAFLALGLFCIAKKKKKLVLVPAAPYAGEPGHESVAVPIEDYGENRQGGIIGGGGGVPGASGHDPSHQPNY